MEKVTRRNFLFTVLGIGAIAKAVKPKENNKDIPENPTWKHIKFVPKENGFDVYVNGVMAERAVIHTTGDLWVKI